MSKAVRRPDFAAVIVVGCLAMQIWRVASTPGLYYMVAVGVEHGHDPDVVVVYQPLGIRVGIVAIEEPGYEAHGNLRGRYLPCVYAGVIPEYRLWAWYGAISDM